MKDSGLSMCVCMPRCMLIMKSASEESKPCIFGSFFIFFRGFILKSSLLDFWCCIYVYMYSVCIIERIRCSTLQYMKSKWNEPNARMRGRCDGSLREEKFEGGVVGRWDGDGDGDGWFSAGCAVIQKFVWNGYSVKLSCILNCALVVYLLGQTISDS